MKTCAACGKLLRPFPVAKGSFAGTVGSAMNLPKIEADHGFVCEQCQSTVCPVCSGKKAGQLGVRAFVCTQCGHQPLKTIYRE
jgi:rubrerythrin